MLLISASSGVTAHGLLFVILSLPWRSIMPLSLDSHWSSANGAPACHLEGQRIYNITSLHTALKDACAKVAFECLMPQNLKLMMLNNGFHHLYVIMRLRANSGIDMDQQLYGLLRKSGAKVTF